MQKIPTETKPCKRCKVPYLGAVQSQYCKPCRPIVSNARQNAYYHLGKAIARGDIVHPSTLKCRDCGGGATSYEHRNYSEPLRVDPICFSCNKRRGAAEWPEIGAIWY